MENGLEHAVEKTMAWYWARPILDNSIVFDAGADSESMYFAQIMASMNALNDRAKINAGELKRFYNKLVRKIVDDKIAYLECDYGPCRELVEVAIECKISTSLFSWKTYTSIRNGKVYAKSGYGQPENMIPLLKEDPVF